MIGSTIGQIDIDLAFKLRFKRGLLLPTDGVYTEPRLKEIADEQAALFQRIGELDSELKAMYLKGVLMMSHHCSSKWHPSEGAETAPIKQIAECVRAHKFGIPGAFITMNHGDCIVWGVGVLLVSWRGQQLTRAVVEAFVPPDSEHASVLIEVIVKVLEELNIMGKMLLIESDQIRIRDVTPNSP